MFRLRSVRWWSMIAHMENRKERQIRSRCFLDAFKQLKMAPPTAALRRANLPQWTEKTGPVHAALFAHELRYQSEMFM